MLPCAFNNVRGLNVDEALHAPDQKILISFMLYPSRNVCDRERRESVLYRGLPIFARAIILQ